MPHKKFPSILPIPKFKSYQEEKAFWKTHNLSDYIPSQWQNRSFYQKNLKKNLTIRFSPEDFTELKKLAVKNKLSVTTFIRQQMLKLVEKQMKLIRPTITDNKKD